MKRLFPPPASAAAALFLFGGAYALAQTQPTDAELIRDLARQVAKLQTQIDDLQRRSVAPVASSQEDPIVVGVILPVDPPGSTSGEESSHSAHSILSSPGLNFHGYADLGYRMTTSSGGTSSFALGQADLFVTSKLSNNLSFLMETAVDSDLNGLGIRRLICSSIPDLGHITTTEHNGKALNFALFAAPRRLAGWQFGASLYLDRLTPDNAPKIRQSIYTAHVVYTHELFEFLNEGVLMRHVRHFPGVIGLSDVPGFYTQFAYRVESTWKPYFR